MIQHFVLIYHLVFWSDAIATSQQVFNSFDLCRNADMRLVKEYNFEGSHIAYKGTCLPVEEKHK